MAVKRLVYELKGDGYIPGVPGVFPANSTVEVDVDEDSGNLTLVRCSAFETPESEPKTEEAQAVEPESVEGL